MGFRIIFFMSCLMLICCKRQADQKIISSKNSTLAHQISETSVYQIRSQWKSQRGDTITLEDLKGSPMVMVMMFTSCKLSCPRLVDDMRGLEKEVSKKKGDVKYVLMSIDPKTDTPKVLNEFAKKNNLVGDQWLLLTGKEEDIRELANVVAVSYKEISPLEFSHSNILTLFDANGELVYQKHGFNDTNDAIVQQVIAL